MPRKNTRHRPLHDEDLARMLEAEWREAAGVLRGSGTDVKPKKPKRLGLFMTAEDFYFELLKLSQNGFLSVPVRLISEKTGMQAYWCSFLLDVLQGVGILNRVYHAVTRPTLYRIIEDFELGCDKLLDLPGYPSRVGGFEFES